MRRISSAPVPRHRTVIAKVGRPVGQRLVDAHVRAWHGSEVANTLGHSGSFACDSNPSGAAREGVLLPQGALRCLQHRTLPSHVLRSRDSRIGRYRLAPQHHFPAAVLDVLAALDWAEARAEGLPVAVGGDSAGGTIAASAALVRHDTGKPVPAQVLAYPPLDPDCASPSYRSRVCSSRKSNLSWFGRSSIREGASQSRCPASNRWPARSKRGCR